MTQRCLHRLGELGDYEFQLAAGETLAFLADRWMDAADVLARLEAKREQEAIAHGDVYARLRG
jgi:hypothetical protein